MLIGLGEDKNPIDFGITRSKIKIKRVTFVKKVNNVFHSVCEICHRAFIFHMLIGLGANMTCIDFGFTMSKVKVTMVLFCIKRFLLIFLITSYHRAMVFHLLIGLGEDMAPIDFEFTRVTGKQC